MTKKAFTTILLAAVASVFFSCTVRKPVASTPPENNDSYRVHYLFEHEGCKVYRFFDKGNYVYFTNCNGDVTAVTSDSTQVRVMGKALIPNTGQTDFLPESD
ncbi:MAG: DUF4884 domain-containing protein [Bacteroidota bacterium]